MFLEVATAEQIQENYKRKESRPELLSFCDHPFDLLELGVNTSQGRST